MKPFFVRRATVEDAAYIAANLRSEDRDEVVALCGIPPSLVLPAYVEEGREVHVAGIQGDHAQVIYGVDPILGVDRAACIWLLSTPVLYEHPVEFVTQSKRLWDEFHERFDLLTNFTDARNTRHHKWLQWLGAKFIRRVEHFGAESRPFLEFASYRCA
jgi:hypothetical protein